MKSDRIKQGERVMSVRGMTMLSRREFSKISNIPFGTIQAIETREEINLTDKSIRRLINGFKRVGVMVTESYIREGKGIPPINKNLHDEDTFSNTIDFLDLIISKR